MEERVSISPARVRTSLDETGEMLERLGLPAGNRYDLPGSPHRFPDGAHYRREIPGLQTPESLKAALEETARIGLTLHRATHTMGIFRNTDRELREMVAIAKEWQVELIMSVGPRATYDISAAARSVEGSRIAYRLRGGDQLARAIEDVKRAVGFGVRGIMVYDEGLLCVVDELRKAGELPANLHIKVSGHCGHGNPASVRLLERLGADTINPVRDLDAPMWAALRQATTLPMDMSTESPQSSGGFLRDYDVAEIVRVAAPIHCKSGGFEQATHAFQSTAEDAKRYATRVELVNRMIETYFPEAVCSKQGPADLAIPE
ncbi:peptidase [Prauserella sp. PE36]|uniref:Peptidase n=2 Tax=Pseudonocardiaceae TaxID=2070 RepID=A0ABY2S3Y8_9PSEU|nr:peptidase [Prauserella sp. PE36]TKG70520.1 peptidase [Prauserella endophytica]